MRPSRAISGWGRRGIRLSTPRSDDQSPPACPHAAPRKAMHARLVRCRAVKGHESLGGGSRRSVTQAEKSVHPRPACIPIVCSCFVSSIVVGAAGHQVGQSQRDGHLDRRRCTRSVIGASSCQPADGLRLIRRHCPTVTAAPVGGRCREFRGASTDQAPVIMTRLLGLAECGLPPVWC